MFIGRSSRVFLLPLLLREEVYVTQLHLPAKEKVERAEAAILETLVFGGLIATAIAAAIYDIGFWVGAW